MSLTITMYGGPLQGEVVMKQSLNFYLGIEPNAQMQLNAQIKLYINQAELTQERSREVDPSKLTWMYWHKTRAQWIPVESYMDQNGYLVCNTDHFSTWTVVELSETTQSTENSIPLEYALVGAVVALLTVTLGIFVYKKRK
jgi:hypothetical protein